MAGAEKVRARATSNKAQASHCLKAVPTSKYLTVLVSYCFEKTHKVLEERPTPRTTFLDLSLRSMPCVPRKQQR